MNTRHEGDAAHIDFWFDFSSPYAYIAASWVDALAAAHHRTVRRHAILLGALFQHDGLKPPVAYPLKGAYSLRDFARTARFHGLAYTPPPVFPMATHNAARVFWWQQHTQGDAAAARWAQHVFRAAFARGLAVHETPVLKTLAAEAGLNADEAEAACTNPTWKDRLRQANEEAVAAGVFGAPFFRIDGEPFWGNDREPQLRRWLAQGPF